MLRLGDNGLKSAVLLRAAHDIRRGVFRKLLGRRELYLLLGPCGRARKPHSKQLFVRVFYLGLGAAKLARGPVGVKSAVKIEPDIQQRNIAVMCGNKLVRGAARY